MRTDLGVLRNIAGSRERRELAVDGKHDVAAEGAEGDMSYRGRQRIHARPINKKTTGQKQVKGESQS